MRISGSFFGAPIDWDVETGEAPASTGDPRPLLAAEQARLGALAGQVRAAANALALDDYGLFRLAVFAVDATAPADADGRLLAVGAVLRNLGYGAVPLRAPGGALVLGVPSSDDGLNVDSMRSTLTIKEGERVTDEIAFHWLEWNGGRLGDLQLATEDPQARALEGILSGNDLVEGPRGALAFFQRRLPEFALERRAEDHLDVYGAADRIAFVNRPDAAAYLDLYPQFKFPWQATLARQEAELLGLAEPLRALAAKLDEERLINTLLRTYQAAFKYVPGPLRSLFETYGADDADCDQMSLLFAASLALIGYQPAELRACEWPHHLGLAIRPRAHGPKEGAAIKVDGHRYVLLDLTFYYRDAHDRLISAWGQVGKQAKASAPTVLAVDPAQT